MIFCFSCIYRLNASEFECSRLRQQLAAYQESHGGEYKAQLEIEMAARKRLELEAERVSAALERNQRDMATVSAKASALRAEGRFIRRSVIEVAEQLRDITCEMQLQLGGVPDVREGGSSSRTIMHLATAVGMKESFPGDEAAGAGRTTAAGADGDALSRPQEIASALDDIRGMVSWLKTIPFAHLKGEEEVRMQKLIAENARLLRDVENSDALHNDRCARLEAEIETLEGLLSNMRHREAERASEFDSRRAELEALTARSRETLTRQDSELADSKRQVAELQGTVARMEDALSKATAAQTTVCSTMECCFYSAFPFLDTCI